MFQVDLVCLSLVRLLVKRFFCKWDRSRDFLTKADNVSFDIESSDDKDSFVVVVVDSLAVCDRVFWVVLEICGGNSCWLGANKSSGICNYKCQSSHIKQWKYRSKNEKSCESHFWSIISFWMNEWIIYFYINNRIHLGKKNLE